MARRLALALTGLLLCSLGAVVLGLGTARADEPVLGEGLGEYAAGRAWFWPAAAVAAAVVAVLGLSWLVLQTRALRLPSAGRRRALTRAATAELADEITGLPGVRDVHVRLTGSRSRRRLDLAVLCEESADLGLLLDRIGEESVSRFRSAADLPDLHAVLRFRLVYRERRVA